MANAETSTAPIIQGGETLSFEHDGRVSELLPIVLLNALLNVLTLSLYRFWSKTRVRRYLWDSTNLLGDRLEYTGTGGELFKGFLFVLFAIFLPIAAADILVTFYFPPDHPIQVVFRLVVGVTFGSLIGVAIYRARRYRLSRTRWRGVRANQSGSSLAYSARYIAFILLTIITLGWVYPVMRMRLMGTMMNNTWFGDRQFHFEGSVGSLYKRFAMCWFLFVGLLLTFGVTLEHLSSGFELATNAENIAEAGAAMAAYGVRRLCRTRYRLGNRLLYLQGCGASTFRKVHSVRGARIRIECDNWRAYVAGDRKHSHFVAYARLRRCLHTNAKISVRLRSAGGTRDHRFRRHHPKRRSRTRIWRRPRRCF